MKCLIFSDSHGNVAHMQKAILRNPDAEVVFFLGDGLSDFDFVMRKFPEKFAVAVRGNCDGFAIFKDRTVEKTEIITLCEKRIVATHGDICGVKYGLGGAELMARKKRADVLLFGHTHIPCEKYIVCEEKEDESENSSSIGIYLFNPGSIGSCEHSFGIMTLTEKGILFSLGRIDQ